MSYVTTRKALGLSTEDVASAASDVFRRGKSILQGSGGILQATKYILEDPALPEIATQVIKLHNLQQNATYYKTISSAPKALHGPPGVVPGIGLRDIVTPLKMYVKFKEQPILGYAALAGVLAVPFLLGYFVGKR